MSKSHYPHTGRRACLTLAAALLPALGAAQAPPLDWSTVVNINDTMPGTTARFNSFNQPSVNAGGLVVVRARSKGSTGGGEPMRGIYTRQMGAVPGDIAAIFDIGTAVPGPNNSGGEGQPTTFTEFPAFARIGIGNATVATRGQSNPLWVYTAPDGSETRVGTSGVYAWRRGTGLSVGGQFGAAPGLEYYGVPGATPGTRFDQFPGAPTVAGLGRIAFKGNWTDVVSKTGVFVRVATEVKPGARMVMIASSDTVIPGQPEGGVRFGSTAPPTASEDSLVFLGVDNEDSPALGGIYAAQLRTLPTLSPLVQIGDPVPGEKADGLFTRLGEALSFDGRYLGFWGSWGSETRPLLLICPTDGNADLIAYCNEAYPEGYWVDVPVHQGFFVHDTATGQTMPVVKTGEDYSDFLYWTFSGRPPGVGEPDGDDPELPRWRSAAFTTVYQARLANRVQAAFKARRVGEPTVDGIYLSTLGGVWSTPLVTVAETGQPGTDLDPMAPVGSAVSALGIEREGLRNGWLVINASMLDEISGESWAGVYVARTR
jgi:hypothetical protein